MESTYFGMNGTGDWDHPDQRPKSYRETAFKLFPDEPTPFTYILSKLPTKTERDPEFKIFEDRLPVQTAIVSTIVIAAAQYAINTIELKTTQMPNPSAAFKVGDLLKLESVSGEIVRVVTIEDPETITVMRHWGWREGDPDGPTGGTGVTTPSTIAVDVVIRWNGSADPEGNGAPKALSKRPTVVTNYTEIFKDSAALTGTAAATDFRPVKDQFSDLKGQAFLRHMMKLEWGFLLGRPEEYEVTNDYGDLTMVRSTGGFRTFVERAGYLTDFGGAVTMDLVQDGMRDAFKYGSKKKLGVIGYQALNILNRVVDAATTWNWDGESKDARKTYGLTVFTLRCPFGVLELVPHALLAESEQYTNDLYIMDTKYLEYVTLPGRDTKWHPDAEDNDEDSKRGYWQTESGLRLAMPECHAVWTDLSAAA